MSWKTFTQVSCRLSIALAIAFALALGPPSATFASASGDPSDPPNPPDPPALVALAPFAPVVRQIFASGEQITTPGDMPHISFVEAEFEAIAFIDEEDGGIVFADYGGDFIGKIGGSPHFKPAIAYALHRQSHGADFAELLDTPLDEIPAEWLPSKIVVVFGPSEPEFRSAFFGKQPELELPEQTLSSQVSGDVMVITELRFLPYTNNLCEVRFGVEWGEFFPVFGALELHGKTNLHDAAWTRLWRFPARQPDLYTNFTFTSDTVFPRAREVADFMLVNPPAQFA